MDKSIKSDLSGIPRTMLIPLRARYLETKKEQGVINDPKTVQILEQIDFDWSGSNEVTDKTQMGVTIRTEILDEQTSRFLSENSECTVVNLGCGLDTRYERLNNGKVNWFDLDVPESIELRKKFFEENERFRFISSSVFHFSWMMQVPREKPVLFIAEGLLMYFTEDEVKLLLGMIGKEFPGSEMILEAMSPFLAKRTHRHPDMKNQTATFKWGISTGKEIESWGLDVRFLGEWYYFDRHIDRMPLLLKVLRLIPPFRKLMKIIHLKF